MVEKIPVKMVPGTFGLMKNIDKTLLVSTGSQDVTELNECKELNALSPNKEYNCTGTVHFFEKEVVNQTFTIRTDYGGKCNAYFCFMFHIFLEIPTMNPIIVFPGVEDIF